jgi:hypothetical protein
MSFYRARLQVATVMLVVVAWRGIAIAEQAAQKPSRAELVAEIAKLRAALSDCQNSRGSGEADGSRADAAASLRAVKSALDGGASLEEFKKYQIESRIKVDALPRVPENRDIRAISDLYRDATIFGIASVTGSIDIDRFYSLKRQYGEDEVISKGMADMKADSGVGLLSSAELEENRTIAKIIFHQLTWYAGNRLSSLK